MATELLPDGLGWVGGVNVGALLQSPLYQQLEPWIRRALDEAGAGALREVEQVVAGGRLLPFTGVAIARGTLDAPAAARGLVARVGEVTERTVNGVTIYEAPGEDAGVAVLGDGLLAAGTASLLEAAAAVRAARRPSTARDEAMIQVQRHIDTSAAAWAVAALPPALVSIVAGGERLLLPGLRELVGASHVGLSLDLTAGLTLRVAARLDSAASARLVASQLNLALGVVRGLGAEKALDQLGAGAHDEVVTLTARVRREVWEQAAFWLAMAAQIAE